MNKETTYTALLPQIAALIKDESNETSVLANVAAALHQAFDNSPDTSLAVPFRGRK